MHTSHDTALYHATLFHAGEKKGFEYFFRTLYAPLCLFATRIIKDRPAAEDLVSDAFMKTWKKHERLDTPGDIKAYLFQVVRNDCYKCIRQKSVTLVFLPDNELSSKTIMQDHMEHHVEAELLARLQNCMKDLPEGCRMVMLKLYIEGKSVADSARELKLAVSTVKTQKLRGLNWLKGRLYKSTLLATIPWWANLMF